MKRKFADIFTLPPGAWGARGEPYFWEDLRLYFLKEDAPLPDNFDSLVEQVHRVFEKLTEHSINERDWFFVDKYAHGGMSSGRVDPSGWRHNGAIFNYLQEAYHRLKEANSLSLVTN